MAPGRGGRGGRGRGGGDKGGGGTGVERRGLGGRGSRGGAPIASATRPLSVETDALATKLQSCAFQKRDAERAEASAARAAADTAKLERERADAEARAEELRRAKAARATLRSLNLDPVRPDAAAFRAMDSSIKRNTALTKKLSKITEETRASILDDLSKVNISKYVTEAVAATVEGKLRAADVPAALEIVSKLHRVYPDFAPALAEALPRFVCPDAKAHAPSATAALAAVRAAASGDAAETETPTPAQRRLKFRLLAEAHLVGILPSAGPVHKCVVLFAAERHDRDSEAFAHSLLALGAFARLFREEYLGVAEDGTTTADGTTSSADGTTSSGEATSGTSGGAGSDLPGAGAAFRLTPERQAAFRAALEGFHAHACDALATEHRALRSVERENARALERVGAVSEAASAAFSAASKARDATMKALGTLSEALRLPMPTLPEEEEEKSRKTEGEVALQRGVDVGWDGSGAAWDDEESKIFYENLPDLRAMVPAALLSSAGANDGGAGDDSASASTSAKAEALLARLPTLVLKDAADTFSCDFCFAAGGAASRRRLVESLASVPRDETQRLPFYARVAATLAAVFPEEVGAPVTAAIVYEFETLRRASAGDRVSLERRATNARYLGELVKFRLVSASFAFDALKALIETFRGFDVDAACALLESCGRYLAKHPDTAARASAILDVFLRLKSVKNLDARQIELVDAAYRACRPPETPARRKTRSPVREYVRHLVYEILSDDALPRVVRQLRKLDWAEHERYVVKCVVKVHRGRFDNVATVARLVGAMSKWRDSFAPRVVDAVLEDVRFGLESNRARAHQRRCATMRLLGELHRAKIVTTSVVFAQLYLLISFGHDEREATVEGEEARDGDRSTSPNAIDPPSESIRVRLVCALLETCGRLFDRGPPRKFLDRFLAFFQRYRLSKDLALDVSQDVADLLAELRPKLVPHETYDAAAAECARIEADEARAARGGRGADANHMDEIVEEEEEEDEADGSEDDDDGSSDDEEYEDDDEKSGSGSDESSKSDSDDDEGSGSDSGSDLDDERSRRVVDEPEERVRRAAPRASREDVADFEREMAKFLGPAAKNIHATGATSGAGAAPGRVSGGYARVGAPGVAGSGARVAEVGTGSGSGGVVAFKMLIRKDGKQTARRLDVPAEADFVVRARVQAEAEARERAELKRLVLASASADDSEQADDDPVAVAAAGRFGEPRGGFVGGRGGGRGGGGRGGGRGRRIDGDSGLNAGLRDLLGGRGGGHRVLRRD